MLAHITPDKLKKDLQDMINRSAEQKDYDVIIMGYGLCGNSISGLTCPKPMIIPRVHDCCSVFMGSKESFLKEFKDSLSMRWCSNGYYERCYVNRQNDLYINAQNKTTAEYLELIEKYGEENADYIWETLHPEVETDETAYIEIDGFEFSGSLAGFRDDMSSQGKAVKILRGNINYLEKLINGPWDDELFLRVEHGQTVTPVFDMDKVIIAI